MAKKHTLAPILRHTLTIAWYTPKASGQSEVSDSSFFEIKLVALLAKFLLTVEVQKSGNIGIVCCFPFALLHVKQQGNTTLTLKKVFGFLNVTVSFLWLENLVRHLDTAQLDTTTVNVYHA